MKHPLFIVFIVLIIGGCVGKKDPAQQKEEIPVPQNLEEASIEELNQLVIQEPNNPEILYYRGLYYQNQEDYKLAIDDFTKSIQLDSGSANAWQNRGGSKFALDDFDGAMEDYSKAIEIKPDFFEAYYNRAMIFDIKEDYEHSIADYTTVIELQPAFVEAIYNRGVNYYMMKELDKACMDFQKAADLGDEDGKGAYQKYCLGKNNSKK